MQSDPYALMPGGAARTYTLNVGAFQQVVSIQVGQSVLRIFLPTSSMPAEAMLVRPDGTELRLDAEQLEALAIRLFTEHDHV